MEHKPTEWKKRMAQLHILDTKYITYYSTDYRRLIEQKQRKEKNTEHTPEAQPFHNAATRLITTLNDQKANMMLARSLPFLP